MHEQNIANIKFHRLLAPEVVSHFQTVITNVANSSSDSTHQFFILISSVIHYPSSAKPSWERRVERSEMLFLVLELDRNI